MINDPVIQGKFALRFQVPERKVRMGDISKNPNAVKGVAGVFGQGKFERFFSLLSFMARSGKLTGSINCAPACNKYMREHVAVFMRSIKR